MRHLPHIITKNNIRFQKFNKLIKNSIKNENKQWT